MFAVQSRRDETLGDYVRRVRNELKLSTTDVQIKSRRGGSKGISDAYITRIENGQVTNVSPVKLRALADGLSVDVDDLFDLVRGKPPAANGHSDPIRRRLEKLPLKYDRTVPGLPPDKKLNVDALVELLDRELDRLNRAR